MQCLCSSEDAMALLDHMETQYYELQLQLYDIQAEILQCEELLLTAQLDSIRRQMTGMSLFHQDYFLLLNKLCLQDKHFEMHYLIYRVTMGEGESELLLSVILVCTKTHKISVPTLSTTLCVCQHVVSDCQDEVVYYDTFESADDIKEDDTAEREELRRLQVSARQLEARRGRITAKRSYLRNKRVCILCSHLYLFGLMN